LTRFTSA